ncbi:hypothetical protein F4781DRAFT_360841 [Annulohypoxylon bovei var. microspora]|nr:hypothetical protein F4781DRAFT_360841 [Annulohypoxylon bovei var. microspora]
MDWTRASGAKTSASRGHSIPGTQRDQDLGDTEHSHLEKLVVHTDHETLERGVTIGIKLLDQLETAISIAETPKVKKWLKSIDDLKKRAKPTPTVIGVVGDAGTGKSSIIHAVLDEDGLLPTGASTSTVIEFAYNHSKDPTEMYQAEVEFLTKKEWLEELEHLLISLSDEDKNEAGSAYAKLKAVYPNMTKEMMIERKPRKLAEKSSIQASLGRIVSLKEGSLKSFSNKLRFYVDTEDQSICAPLVKRIRIYTKAEVLSTGVVLADIPVIQDSSTAREAAADNCMKSCASVWVVMPISRAIAADRKEPLLGKAFKRQLKYDGIQSDITFIASKTDEWTEVPPSLITNEESRESRNGVHELENSERSKSLLEELKRQRGALNEQADEIEIDKDIWEGFLSQLSNGKTVYDESGSIKNKMRSKSSLKGRKIRGSDRSDKDKKDDVSKNDSSN